jgi:hypothetical protein
MFLGLFFWIYCKIDGGLVSGLRAIDLFFGWGDGVRGWELGDIGQFGWIDFVWLYGFGEGLCKCDGGLLNCFLVYP